MPLAALADEPHRAPWGQCARRILVIYNPAAGRRRHRRLIATLDALRAQDALVGMRETAGPGDAERLARSCLREFDVVVAAGGDGTVNEVINGLMARDPDLPLPALAIIPLGTTNVLARELGFPAGIPALTRMIATGRAQTVYLGESNGRRFSLMAGVGLDAHVVDRTDLRLKRRVGKLAYILQMLREVTFFTPRAYRVEIDGTQVARAASVVVARSRFYGGPFQLAPDACIRTPELHVCLFERGDRWSTLLYLLGIIMGRLAWMPGYRVVRASRVVVTGRDGDPVQIDGDTSTRLPLVVGLCDRPLSVIAP